MGSGKAFGTNERLISAAEAKEKFPLLEEHLVQGALWDPDAGLVTPRSRTVVGELVQEAEASGKLRAFANTPASGLVIEGGRIRGVETRRGTIETGTVVVCAARWGRLIAARLARARTHRQTTRTRRGRRVDGSRARRA